MNSLFILSVLLCAATYVYSRDQRSFFSWGDDQPKEEESPAVIPGYKPILNVRRYNAIQVNPVNGGPPMYYESNSPISMDQFNTNTGSQLSNDELRYFDLLNKYGVPAFLEEGLRDVDVTSLLPLVNLIPDDSIDRLSYAVESAPATQVKEKSKFLALLAYLKELKLKPFKYVAHIGSELIHKKKQTVQNALGYLVPSLTTPQTPTLYDSEPALAPYLYNYGPVPSAYPSLALPQHSHQANYFSHQPIYQHPESGFFYNTNPPSIAMPQQSIRQESIPLPTRFYTNGGFSEYPSNNFFHLNGVEGNSNKFYHSKYNPFGSAVPTPSQSFEPDGQKLSDIQASRSPPAASLSRPNYLANSGSGASFYANPSSTNKQQSYSELSLPSQMVRVGKPTQHTSTNTDSTSYINSGDMETSASETVQKISASAQQQHKLSDGGVQPESDETTMRSTQNPLLIYSVPTDESIPNDSKQAQFSSSKAEPTTTPSPVS